MPRRRDFADSDSSDDGDEDYVTWRRRSSVLAERGLAAAAVASAQPGLGHSSSMALGRSSVSGVFGRGSVAAGDLEAMPSLAFLMQQNQSHASFRRGTLHEQVDAAQEAASRRATQIAVEEAEEEEREPDFYDDFDVPLICLPPHRAPALEHSSLFLLDGRNPFRVFMHNVVKSRAFEAFIIFMIGANSIVLILDDPTTDSEEDYIVVLDIFFAVVFTIEMIAKVIAFGFVLHPHAYLRDRWNDLDFLIVVLAWLAFVPGFGNYSALRVLRVLRPLRSMNAVKGLKVLVTALLQSFGGLVPVLLLGTILLSIFAIVGTQLFSGDFRYACVTYAVDPNSPNMTTRRIEHHDGYRCDPDSTDFTGSLGTSCPDGYICERGDNPNFGFVNFDHTGYALLVVFQVVTFEGWPFVLRTALEVAGVPAFLYFLALVLIGSYFLPNLALAVINDKYHGALEKHYRSEFQRAQRDLEERRAQKLAVPGLARVQAPTTPGFDRTFPVPPSPREGRRLGPTTDVVQDNEALIARQDTETEQTLQEAEAAREMMERLSKRRGSRRLSHLSFAPTASDNNFASSAKHENEDGVTRTTSNPGLTSPGLTSPATKPVSPQSAEPLSRVVSQPRNVGGGGDDSPQNAGRPGEVDSPTIPIYTSAPGAGTTSEASSRSTSPLAATATGTKSAFGDLLVSTNMGTPEAGRLPAVPQQDDVDGGDATARSGKAMDGFEPISLDDVEDSSGRGNLFVQVAPNDGATVDDADPFRSPQSSSGPEADDSADNSTHVGARSSDDALQVGVWLQLRNVCHEVVLGVELPEYVARLEEIDVLQRERDRVKAGEDNPFSVSLFVPENFGAASPSSRVEEMKQAADSSSAANTTPFTIFIVIMIMLNTILLAAQHHNQPDWLTQLTYIGNIIFLVIFAVEVTIVLIAVGLKRFFTSGFYVFDLAVVILSTIELFVTGGSVVMVFRALRLLRILKLLRNSPQLQSLVTVILNALQDTLYLTLVMFLLILIFALAGMQFFGGELRRVIERDYPDVEARAHFDTFLNAFYTVFQVVSLDNWVDIMWMAMESTNYAACIYFIVLVIVGFYIVLNLFLSILIQGFENNAAIGEAGADEFDKEHRAAIVHLQKSVVVRVSEKQYDQSVDVSVDREAEDAGEVSMMVVSVASPVIRSTNPLMDASKTASKSPKSAALDAPDNTFGVGAQPPPPMSAWSESSTGAPRHTAAEVDAALDDPDVVGSPLHKKSAAGPASLSAAASSRRRSTATDGIGASDSEFAQLALRGPRRSRTEEMGLEDAPPALEKQESQGSPTVPRAVAEVPVEAVAAGAFAIDGVPISTHGVCNTCGSVMQRVLPGPPFEARLSDPEFHDGHCWLAEHRVQRERDIADLLLTVHEKVTSDALLTVPEAEDLLQQAHTRGLLRNVPAEDLLSWEAVRDELREELMVVRLAVGEEQLGRAHIGYVHAGLRLVQDTNGSTSLFLLGPHNKFRIALTAVINNPVFDAAVLLLIIASTIVLVIDAESDLSDEDRNGLQIADLTFSCIFALEIVLRVLATGLFMHPGAYLRSGWHWLDLISVVISFVSSLSSAKALRVMRFVRPLRTIKRYRGLRIVATTILNSIRGIVHVALLSTLNYLMFGILAVQLFGGRLYACSDESITRRLDCIGSFNRSVLVFNGTHNVLGTVQDTRRWEVFDRNFDHIGTSMLTLFQVSSGDDWADVMYTAIDARSTDEAPARDSQPYAGLFFVAFFIVSNFFLLNLFVGVVIVNFSRVKEKVDGLSFLTDAQREWVDAQRAMLNLRPEVLLLKPEDAHGWRKRLDAVVRSSAFEYAIAICIALNVIIIGMEYDGMSADYKLTLRALNLMFVCIFVVEILLKLLAHRLRFFMTGWNRFDFVIILISVAAAVVTFAADSAAVDFQVVNVLRFLRLLRIVRLIKKARRVRILVETLWYSLPSIGNISLLIVIVYIVYAVVGLQIFSSVRTDSERTRFLDDQFFNFKSFVSSMQLLFIFTTNEKWSDAMYDLMVSEPYCDSGAGECGIAGAPAYFTSFTVIASFVMTNLFLAIILDNFATTIQMDESRVTLSDLHRFTALWALYDPDATMLMPTKGLPHLLANLQPPLGTTRADSRLQQLKRMAAYRILDHCGSVHFAEVMVPLARACIEEVFDNDGGDTTVVTAEQQQLLGFDMTAQQFPELITLPTVWYAHQPGHVGHTLAATYVAASYRRHLAIKRVRRLRSQQREELEVSRRNCNSNDEKRVQSAARADGEESATSSLGGTIGEAFASPPSGQGSPE